MAITKLRIFPSIGVARLGNSDTEFFLGPEIPGVVPSPAGGYRDATRRIKPQGARFRLFGYDEADALVGEVTADAATITWSVHLANTKASAEWFGRKDDLRPLRNASVTGNRAQLLNLDAGDKTISGKNPGYPSLPASRAADLAIDLVVNKNLFGKPVSVTLGTILTDGQGRLVVLGGRGQAGSPTNRSLDALPGNFANHDEWFDDVADGRVSATVKLADGSTPPVLAAWVITAPPKFAPGIQHVVSLQDALLQAMVDRNLMADPTAAPGYQPVYSRDILPILKRAFDLRWVYSKGAADPASRDYHLDFDTLPPEVRADIFRKLGKPPPVAGDPSASTGKMPKMWSDRYDKAMKNGTLTRIQYANMSLWSAGTYVDDSAALPAPPAAVTPEGLTQAALEPCIGSPLYPGIEASWKLRDNYAFQEPFRLAADQLRPGAISEQMSLPWQSDFLDCAVESASGFGQLVWWPAQRPINVISGGAYVDWARDPGGGTGAMDEGAMVTQWWRLGFLLEQPDQSIVEVDRVPGHG